MRVESRELRAETTYRLKNDNILVIDEICLCLGSSRF